MVPVTTDTPSGTHPQAGTKPRRAGHLPHFPALDGIRGVALVAILLTHAGISWAPGGFIALTVFFTLSGFLITSLLLVERSETGTVRLDNFWVRRARRLVPAIVIAFLLIAALLPSIDNPPRGLIGDAVAASVWVANWRFVFAHRTYADIFSSPSPFQHFWSLAVEEQFYLLFPPLLVVLIGRARRVPRRKIAAVVGALAAASFGASLYVSSTSSRFRAYYGTDVRAIEILVGVLLAVALCKRATDGGSGLPRRLSQVLGVAGAAVLVWAFIVFKETDRGIYRGGFLAVALASAMLVTSALDRGTLAERTLSWRPFVFLGTISYGVYLYHWPIFLALTEGRTGLSTVPLLAVRLALTLSLAYLSHRFVEQPIRRNGLPTHIAPAAWLNGALAGLALIALASGQITPATTHHHEAAAGTLLSAGAGSEPSSTSTTTSVPTTDTTAQPATAPTSLAATSKPAERPRGSRGTTSHGSSSTTSTTHTSKDEALPAAFYEDPSSVPVPAPPADTANKLRVAIVGDSVGVNMGDALDSWSKERNDVAVLSLAIPGCPLSRGKNRRFSADYDFSVDPACAWWADPTSDRSKVLASFKPQVLVVLDGINEFFDRKPDGWDSWYQPEQPKLAQWIRNEYAASFSALAKPYNAKVIAVNALCGDWSRYDTFSSMSAPDLRIRALNTTVYPLLGNVTVADMFGRVCPNGQFSNTVEGVENGRPDGIHFSKDAGLALARNWLGPLILQNAAPPAPSLLGG